jgi:hypothetical protein
VGEDEDAVLGGPDVDLDAVDTRLEGGADGGERVLGVGGVAGRCRGGR